MYIVISHKFTTSNVAKRLEKHKPQLVSKVHLTVP